MVKQLRQLIKPLLKLLPQNDYPVLDSQLFVLIWIHFILDARVSTMRGLFFFLNHLGFDVKISTFSKACKHRSTEPFQRILKGLQQRLQNRDKGEFQHLFPLDSTIITLTSKLFWQHKIYLDRIITKNENGVRLQIYVVLIGLINYDIYR